MYAYVFKSLFEEFSTKIGLAPKCCSIFVLVALLKDCLAKKNIFFFDHLKPNEQWTLFLFFLFPQVSFYMFIFEIEQSQHLTLIAREANLKKDQ